MPRTILHSDMNGFYASVECLYNPAIRGKPVVVGGSTDARHGIILAKNEIAKKFGIQTGEATWQARQKCPELVVVPPHFDRYVEFSNLSREIYNSYTDQVEPFGLDEAFLDVGGSRNLFGDGEHIANEIRARIRRELGVTVSIGVSYNKIFAKLGSDMKKPDATTIITPGDYRQKVWPLPVSDLLYVGPATTKKLSRFGITTIGRLAQADPGLLQSWLGKWGLVLHSYANGQDASVVRKFEELQDDDSGVKSIGNSTTTPRDLVNEEDVKITVWLLAESVAARLREHRRLCKTVQLYVRDNTLHSFERQCKVQTPTQLACEIAQTAMALFHASCSGFGTPGSQSLPLRSVGVRAGDLVREQQYVQLSYFPEERKRQHMTDIEHTMDDIRDRYGHTAISRGMMLFDRKLSKTNPKSDHVMVFPATRFH